MDFSPEWIGMAAAIFTTTAYIPQAIKVIASKQTGSISFWMYALMSLGVGLWFIYGLLIHSPSVIIANGITFLLACAILLLKLRHG